MCVVCFSTETSWRNVSVRVFLHLPFCGFLFIIQSDVEFLLYLSNKYVKNVIKILSLSLSV